MKYLYVGIGGCLGAVLRYGLSLIVVERIGYFPLDSLIVNISGTFLLSYVSYHFFRKLVVAAEIQAGLSLGLFGSFTTFSTFGLDTVLLLEEGKWIVAWIYVLLTLLGSSLAAYAAYLFRPKLREQEKGERL